MIFLFIAQGMEQGGFRYFKVFNPNYFPVVCEAHIEQDVGVQLI